MGRVEGVGVEAGVGVGRAVVMAAWREMAF
jgi:hypothetical protein